MNRGSLPTGFLQATVFNFIGDIKDKLASSVSLLSSFEIYNALLLQSILPTKKHVSSTPPTRRPNIIRASPRSFTTSTSPRTSRSFLQLITRSTPTAEVSSTKSISQNTPRCALDLKTTITTPQVCRTHNLTKDTNKTTTSRSADTSKSLPNRSIDYRRIMRLVYFNIALWTITGCLFGWKYHAVLDGRCEEVGEWWERNGEEGKGGKSKPFSISDELWLILSVGMTLEFSLERLF